MLRPFLYAVMLRCPRCGVRGIVEGWFRLPAACPRCALAFDRGESGYQVGSYMVGMILIELLFVALLAGIIAASWPTPPWTLLQWGGPLLMIVGPLVIFPFTKTLYLAFDLTFRPEP
jgi:uncharacterized protein (DUF983 family)